MVGESEIVVRAEGPEGALGLPGVRPGGAVEAGESAQTVAALELVEIIFEGRKRWHRRTLDQGERSVPRGWLNRESDAGKPEGFTWNIRARAAIRFHVERSSSATHRSGR